MNDFSGTVSPAPLKTQYDVLVLGSGAAGLATALFSALRGMNVLVIEESAHIGGTSALSGGTTWAPLSSIGKAVNDSDSLQSVTTFLDSIIGNQQKDQRDHFLQKAGLAIQELEDKTHVHFRPCPKHPDYIWTNDDATLNGRAIEPVPFSTRGLGKLRELIRPPIPEFTVLKGMQIDRVDIGNLLKRFSNIGSFFYVARLVTRYALDRLLFGRHTRLVMGQALIARFFQSCLEHNVEFVTEATVIRLIKDKMKIQAITVSKGNEEKTISIGALVAATGGLGQHPTRRGTVYPKTLSPYSPANPENKGSFHDLLDQENIGYGSSAITPAFYAPVSVRKRVDGTTAVYPHFVFDRSKPGTLCVNDKGQRFINETISYHDFGKTVLNNDQGDRAIWLIADSKAITKYGLGMLRPGGDNPIPLIRNGYLKTGSTVSELAIEIGVDTETLAKTVDRFNGLCKTGTDDDFGRGSTEYQRHNGDPTHGPNPTMRALEGPFYAVQLFIGDIGSATGFSTTPFGQIMAKDGSVWNNLYAAGGDMLSVMAGHYPGPGITIGPGITFGYIAANHINDTRKGIA